MIIIYVCILEAKKKKKQQMDAILIFELDITKRI